MLTELSREERHFAGQIVRWDKEERGRVRFVGHLFLMFGAVVFVYCSFSVYWGSNPLLLGFGFLLLLIGLGFWGTIEAVSDRYHKTATILLKLEPTLAEYEPYEPRSVSRLAGSMS